MNEVVNEIADYLLVSVLIPNVIFAFRYYFRSPFEKYPEGRNLLYQKIAVSSLILIITLSVLFGPDWFLRPWVRLLVFGAIVFFYWRELYQLIQVQKHYPFRRRIQIPRRRKS